MLSFIKTDWWRQIKKTIDWNDKVVKQKESQNFIFINITFGA